MFEYGRGSNTSPAMNKETLLFNPEVSKTSLVMPLILTSKKMQNLFSVVPQNQLAWGAVILNDYLKVFTLKKKHRVRVLD